MMKKESVLDALIAALEAELKDSVAASKDAAEYATNSESRADSKWDTQGLEASYLAAGQAEQARQWAEAIELLKSSRTNLLAPRDEVALGALMTCEINGARELFFLAPAGGGQVLNLEGGEVTVITLQSPLAARVVGRRAGESFSLPNGAAGSVAEVG